MLSTNDVLLKHHDHVLSFALNHSGNFRLLAYLEIYRRAYINAEKEFNDKLCSRIVSDIVDTICRKSIPSGRFLEFDAGRNEWRHVGSAAVPRHRVRMGLLGFISFEPLSFNKKLFEDKPIVLMSKEERARTMKSLHAREEQMRANVNLKDNRFLVKDELLKEASLMNKNTSSEKRKREQHEKKLIKKKKKLKRPLHSKKINNHSEVKLHDIICDENGNVVLQEDNLGNKYFRYLVFQRRQAYDKTDDAGKFHEVGRVIRSMFKLFPQCRFFTRKDDRKTLQEASWETCIIKTIETFCEASYSDTLSPAEIKYFSSLMNGSFNEDYILDEVICEQKGNISSGSSIISEDLVSLVSSNDEDIRLDWNELPDFLTKHDFDELIDETYMEKKDTPDIPGSLFENNWVQSILNQETCT